MSATDGQRFIFPFPQPADSLDFVAIFDTVAPADQLVDLSRARHRLMDASVEEADAERYLALWDRFIYEHVLNRKEQVGLTNPFITSWVISPAFGGSHQSSLLHFETSAATLAAVALLFKRNTTQSLHRAETLCRCLSEHVLVTQRDLFCEQRQHPFLSMRFVRALRAAMMGMLAYQYAKEGVLQTRPALLARAEGWFKKAGHDLPQFASLTRLASVARSWLCRNVAEWLYAEQPEQVGVAIACLNRSIEVHPQPPPDFLTRRDEMLAANKEALGCQDVPKSADLVLSITAEQKTLSVLLSDDGKIRILLPAYDIPQPPPIEVRRRLIHPPDEGEH